MRISTLIDFVAAFSTQVFAACQAPTKVDDFSKWSSNTNSLGEWTSGKEHKTKSDLLKLIISR